MMHNREELEDCKAPLTKSDWAGTAWKTAEDALERLVVTYVRSGIPLTLGVPGHAIVNFGLREQPKPLVPREGRLVLASDFVEALIVNDDNHAPYRVVGREAGISDTTYGWRELTNS